MLGNRHLPGFEERCVDVRGTRLRSFESGAGPRVASCTGSAGRPPTGRSSRRASPSAAACSCPSCAGHGGSSPLPGPAETLDPYADRLAALLGGPAVVVGHSLGAVTGMRIAQRHPELVRGLVLAASAGIGSSTRRTQRALTLVSLLKPGKRISPLRRAVAEVRFSGASRSASSASPIRARSTRPRPRGSSRAPASTPTSLGRRRARPHRSEGRPRTHPVSPGRPARRARRAGAVAGRLRVRASPGRTAEGRRRLRSPADRRAAAGRRRRGLRSPRPDWRRR